MIRLILREKNIGLKVNAFSFELSLIGFDFHIPGLSGLSGLSGLFSLFSLSGLISNFKKFKIQSSKLKVKEKIIFKTEAAQIFLPKPIGSLFPKSFKPRFQNLLHFGLSGRSFKENSKSEIVLCLSIIDTVC
ncbi:MAG: hypothetical protein AB1659_12640, partial [Thermodesulfobacteriota bacterium]